MTDLFRAPFSQLSVGDLYDLLALRVRVFVVEQECAFQELDGLDAQAEHVWTRGPAGEIAAYLRVLGEGPDTRLGRIVTAPEHRSTGAGAALMRAVLEGIDGPVVLGAQVRAQGFYERLGFVVDGPGYDEDGIPHVPMRRSRALPDSERRAPSVG
ncbi:GNAT family N-acetyltransferase [Actinomycetospora succinea]|uniref:GNAT family N-acetyltransferase n=1 Tax=Actinomycetospora succinea TaxID=663603 RepID=UPI00105FD770|nr:GNAT family N-acetyltransferase [Actinomycetospora succinea]